MLLPVLRDTLTRDLNYASSLTSQLSWMHVLTVNKRSQRISNGIVKPHKMFIQHTWPNKLGGNSWNSLSFKNGIHQLINFWARAAQGAKSLTHTRHMIIQSINSTKTQKEHHISSYFQILLESTKLIWWEGIFDSIVPSTYLHNSFPANGSPPAYPLIKPAHRLSGCISLVGKWA